MEKRLLSPMKTRLLFSLLMAGWLIQAHAADIPETRPPDDPTAPSDLWDRLRNGFSLSQPEDSGNVQQMEAWYEDHPKSIETLAERSKRYLYYIVGEVENRGMPAEIALVPMIESGFNPLVYSRYHAAGLWQLLPGTGRNFGLRSNKGYDGRRDIIAATDAALKYLAYLHSLFGDWELALAAYNAGEGTVSKALHRNRENGLETDFASLNLPNETRNFYTRLIALRNILSDPARFGLDLAPIPDKPYFSEIRTRQNIDIRLAAHLAEIPVSEFVALNPGATRQVWPAKEAKSILLPSDNAEIFASNLEAMPPASSPKQGKKRMLYHVRKDDTLLAIAHRFGVSATDIERWNRTVSARNLRIGAKIVLFPEK
ncbi:MAG: transglycosylase SLT domain-containing protein [Burkholderiales bacterium]